jgi:hypothetical protein
MFAVMYTMVEVRDDMILNLNQFYMTMMMVLPMTIGMLLLMPSMYPNKKLNSLLYGLSTLLFLFFFYFMRSQTFIDDRQFLKSMIPHHSGALLMCKKANLTDPEVIKFCKGVIETQDQEIKIMKQMLERLPKS